MRLCSCAQTAACAAGTCPPSQQQAPCLCYDIPPTGSKLTCVQQVRELIQSHANHVFEAASCTLGGHLAH